jgi:hypothetical protein
VGPVDPGTRGCPSVGSQWPAWLIARGPYVTVSYNESFQSYDLDIPALKPDAGQ